MYTKSSIASKWPGTDPDIVKKGDDASLVDRLNS